MLAANYIYQTDAFAGLKRLDAESVDLVLTDPPFNLAREGKRTLRDNKIVTTMEAWGSWDHYDPFDYDLLILRLISESYRVLRPGGAFYMFSADNDNGYFIRRAVDRGFLYRNQIVLLRRNPLPSLTKRNWRRAFELCMYLTKGMPRTFHFDSQAAAVNVFPYAVRSKQTKHPTEKPLAAIQRLVEASSDVGDLVVDPFVGSGTTALAAKLTGRRYIGFERSRAIVRMTRRRLRDEAAPASTLAQAS